VKKILSFECDEDKDAGDEDRLLCALQAEDWKGVVVSTLEEIRKIIKYGDDSPKDLELVRKFIYTEIQERGLFVP